MNPTKEQQCCRAVVNMMHFPFVTNIPLIHIDLLRQSQGRSGPCYFISMGLINTSTAIQFGYSRLKWKAVHRNYSMITK